MNRRGGKISTWRDRYRLAVVRKTGARLSALSGFCDAELFHFTTDNPSSPVLPRRLYPQMGYGDGLSAGNDGVMISVLSLQRGLMDRARDTRVARSILLVE